MSKFCTNCGAEIADDVVFCTECGTKVEASQPNATVEQTQSAAPATDVTLTFGEAPKAPEAPVIPTPQPVYQAAPQPVYQAPADGKEIAPVVKTGAFFWLDILYVLPGIGFIACIVVAAASKNANIRHHAAAKLIEVLVGFVLGIIAVILCMAAIKRVGISVNDLLNSYGNLY